MDVHTKWEVCDCTVGIEVLQMAVGEWTLDIALGSYALKPKIKLSFSLSASSLKVRAVKEAGDAYLSLRNPVWY